MGKELIVTYTRSFDLTDAVADRLNDDGESLDGASFETLEMAALAELEDYDFNKRAQEAMTVTFDEPADDVEYVLVIDTTDRILRIPAHKIDHWKDVGEDQDELPDYAEDWDWNQKLKLTDKL